MSSKKIYYDCFFSNEMYQNRFYLFRSNNQLKIASVKIHFSQTKSIKIDFIGWYQNNRLNMKSIKISFHQTKSIKIDFIGYNQDSWLKIECFKIDFHQMKSIKVALALEKANFDQMYGFCDV